MPEKTKVSPRLLRTLLGIEPTAHANSSAAPDNVAFVNRYTRSEKSTLMHRLFVRQDPQNAELTTGGIISYLQPVHKKIAEKSSLFHKLKALTPEIKQSAILVASSIMSPNDLKEGEFTFNFSNISGVGDDPDLSNELSEVFDLYFNKTKKLGKESFNWIQKIMYEDGAKAILILPPATQQALLERTEEDKRKHQQKAYGMPFSANNYLQGYAGATPGFASFSEYLKAESTKDPDDYMWSGKPCTWKDYFKGSTEKDTLRALVPEMQSFGAPIPHEYLSEAQLRNLEQTKTRNAQFNQDVSPEYKEALESITVNIRTTLEEGDVIKVSENPEILRFNVAKGLTDKQQIIDKLKEKYKLRRELPQEDIVTLESNPEGYAHFGHPTTITLPVESVVPVCVPGAPSEHLGYFILIDENGNPMTKESSGILNDDCCGSSNNTIDASYEAVFGSRCCTSFLNNGIGVGTMGNLIFQNILDGYLRTRIHGILGRDDISVDRFNSIATVLFYRLLQRKHTTMVFVYPELLHYFAFEYRPDGTGMSKIEDIETLVSLRTTFMIANVMAMARDAVAHKKISIGTDDKNANLEATIDLIYNLYGSKRKFDATTCDPSEIIRNIYSSGLSLEPKNFPGLSEFSVETEQVSGNNQTGNFDQLGEQLTNLIVSDLDVPPAALNQLSEPEYSRSLVTFNLFFAKRIMELQDVYCGQITSFIRSYITYDPIIQKALLKKLESNGKKQVKERASAKVAKMASTDPNVYHSNNSTILQDIINNFYVELPSPQIVVDKAQFNELREFLGNLGEVADQYFPQDMIPSEDSAAQNGLNILKAKFKKDAVFNFISRMGMDGFFERPDIDDMDTDEVVDFIQTMQNTNSKLTRQREHLSEFANGGGQDDSVGGGDAFGGGFDMGGDLGGGDAFGGGDTGGGEDAFGGTFKAQPDKPTTPKTAPKMTSTAGKLFGNK